MENLMQQDETMKTENAYTDGFLSVILLTDFSEPAKNAIRYAIDAFGDQVEYQLVNAYYARTSSATLLDLNDILAKESEQGLTEESKWIQEAYPQLTNLTIKTHSIFGSPIDAIKRLKGEKEHDLVLMGTKGTSGVEAVLFGSVASSVIRGTVIPVISVPPSCKFKGFNGLVFATDGKEIEDDRILEPVEKIQKQFNSEVSIFSVDKNRTNIDFSARNLEIKNANYTSVESTKNISEEVTNFCRKKDADLLVILPKRTGFFDRVFHKSVSKDLVERAQLPILALENY